MLPQQSRKFDQTALHRIMLICCLTGMVTVQAQFTKTVNGVRVSLDTSRINDMREKLVQLALQNALFEIADRNVDIAHYQLNAAKGDWFSLVQPSLNLNSITVKQTLYPTDQIFFPLYNVGIGLPLNFFSQKKNNVKVARERIFIAEAEKKDQYQRIRKAVLTAYEDYLMHRDLLDLQNLVMQDAKLESLQAEEDFKNDNMDAAAYAKAKTIYREGQMRQREMQRNVEMAKITLEQLIGVSLDDVLGKR